MQNFSEPPIWITGSKGQLGSELIKLCQEHNIPFYATDKEVSIVNKKQISSFIKDKEISYVINCAAFTDVEKAESHVSRAYDLNCIGPENLARITSERGIPLIHISTDYVFDGSKKKYVETDKASPLNSYGRTKLFGELSVQLIQPKHYIIRTSRLYSPDSDHNFIYKILKLFHISKTAQMVTNQWSSPTCAYDLAETILTVITEPLSLPYGIYHYCNSGTASWCEIAIEVLDELKKYKEIECEIQPVLSSQYVTQAARPEYSTLDTTKLQETLNIYIPSWKDSLHKSIPKFLEKFRHV